MAWLTVDEGDNGPVVLWAHAIEALRRVCPKIGEQVVGLLACTADGAVVGKFAGHQLRIGVIPTAEPGTRLWAEGAGK